MKIQEKFKRLVRLLFSAVLVTVVSGIYGYTWINYFNTIIRLPFFRRGNWMMIFLYIVILFFMMKMYGGFTVGLQEKGKLIFSQLLSVVFTNTFTYFQISVLAKKFFNPFSIIGITIVQIIIIIIWSLIYQRIYIHIFPPRNMLLISGRRSDYYLMEKMNLRMDKCRIDKSISYKSGIQNIIPEIDKYDGIIIGDMPSHERNLILKVCFDKNVRTYSVPKISDVLLRSSEQLTLFDTPLLLSKNDGLLIEQMIIKRLVDIVLSCIAVIITLPLFLIIAVCIKLDDRGPVFYKQKRLTYCGKVFEIYKFRTMIQNAEKKSGPRLAGKEDERILRVGKILRRTRLDELPQIYNVLKGDMSFVGPRPERPELAQRIEKELPEFCYRLKVKAGLTGYAQIYGKYNTTSYDKLKLDLTYIRNYSIWLDFKLMILTPKIMLMKESTEGVESKEDLHDKNV